MNDETNLKCPLCNQVFEDQNMLIYHTNEVHKSKKIEKKVEVVAVKK